MEILCKRLKKLREELNLSQEDVGRVIGVNKSAISYYEKGRNIPSIEYLAKLAEYYNKSLDYFVGHDYYAISDNDADYGKRVKLSNEEIKFIQEIRKDNKLYSQLLDNPENLVGRMQIKL